jgi:hypothetical protein
MSSSLRQHVTIMIVAALGVMIGSVGPSVARAAYDAVNADKVDGKHAVGAGATVTQRKGKLVATSPTTGRLPNNIIAKAPDSDKLNGYSHKTLRNMPLQVQGAYTGGAAAPNANGVQLPAAGFSVLTVGFVIPADHPANAPMWVDMTYVEAPTDCAVQLSTEGLAIGSNGSYVTGGWNILPANSPSGGLMQVAHEGGAEAHQQTFAWPFTSYPGLFVQFQIARYGDDVADTCNTVLVAGLQLRY